MKNIHVLLANTDRRTNSLIEAAVLDVCYNQAAVESTKISRVDDLVRYGGHAAIQLIVLAPDHLLVEPSRGSRGVKTEEVAAAIRTIKSDCATPILAVNVSPEDEVALLQAGADSVHLLPFNPDAFRSEIRQILRMPELVQEPEVRRWSFASLFT